MRSSSIHCRYRWLLLCKCCVSYCFCFCCYGCKDSDYFHISKNYFTFFVKIAGCRLKIAIQHPKISGLKISVDSLKIAGLKIIARVCVCVCAWVRGWVRSHFAEVSKIVQDTPRAGTQAPEQPRPERERPRPNTGTQATTTRAAPPNTSTRATTARAPKPERNHRSESATRASAPAHAHPIRKRN